MDEVGVEEEEEEPEPLYAPVHPAVNTRFWHGI